MGVVMTDTDADGLAVIDVYGFAVTDVDGLAVTDVDGLATIDVDGLPVTDYILIDNGPVTTGTCSAQDRGRKPEIRFIRANLRSPPGSVIIVGGRLECLE
jgi:hypothetical protein